jgi:homoserine kinase
VSAEPADEWSIYSGDESASEETVAMVRAVAGEVDPHSVRIDSEIPAGRGLGSSGAVLVAVAAAVGESDRRRLFEAASLVEGHADNVAASVFGGLVAVGADGSINRLSVHPSLHLVIAVPDEVLLTVEARAVLPDVVPRDVAVRTAARLATLIEALRTGSGDSFAAALGDEMHEKPRGAITQTPAMLIEAALDAGSSFAAWSGAGPSVVAIALEETLEAITGSMEQALAGAGSVLDLDIDREGVRYE